MDDPWNWDVDRVIQELLRYLLCGVLHHSLPRATPASSLFLVLKLTPSVLKDTLPESLSLNL